MASSDEPVDLSAALDQFDRTLANVDKLEGVWKDLSDRDSGGVTFGLDTDETEDLREAFEEIAGALPSINGYRVEAVPWAFDSLAQARFDAMELGETQIQMGVDRDFEEPGRQVAEYRRRLTRTRRELVRGQIIETVDNIDAILRDADVAEFRGHWRGADRWEELKEAYSALQRLVSATMPGRARWGELRRHLHFAEDNDLSDIVTLDWPSVRAEVEAAMYTDREPLPVSTDDLGDLVRARPSGPVTTRLEWDALTPDDFERLIFEMIRQTKGYENANWLMKTNATDRSRDLACERVVNDPLSGTRRYRVIVQCKHWLSKSVGLSELTVCLSAVTLWEPPTVDEVIIATSGRFSGDAVAFAEKHNHERKTPTITLWPESHLEALLAARPAIAAAFRLR